MQRPFGPRALVDPRTAPWADEYPFTSQYLNVGAEGAPPLWLHYLDEGPREAPVLLFLHGNPTWSFIWRRLIVALRDRFRCIAVDHMGMGLSDRPQGWSYTLVEHVANVERLLDALDIERFSLLCHDWGGMIGMTLATRRADRYESGVVMNTAAFLGALPRRIGLVKVPVLGSAAVLHGNAFARAAVELCMVHRERMNATLRHAYLAPYSNAHDRIATLRFVEDVPQKASHPTHAVVQATDQALAQLRERPLLVLWGEQDWCFTMRFFEGWKARFPACETEVMPQASHYVFEDEPERVTSSVARFFDRVLGERAQDAAE
ncbi:MAG: alpha/beta fold hydrolase [Myxococcota bacterium]